MTDDQKPPNAGSGDDDPAKFADWFDREFEAIESTEDDQSKRAYWDNVFGVGPGPDGRT
ncbi:MAG: hypothetical protein ACI8RE_002692, partial [Ilumatobacter sp.]